MRDITGHPPTREGSCNRPFIHRIATPFVWLTLACAQGCQWLNHDGIAGNDDLAFGCGVLGLIAFFAGVKEGQKHLGFVVFGVILILA